MGLLLVLQVHLYGTSLGGFLAQMFAQHRPRRVKSLLLSNTYVDNHTFQASMSWSALWVFCPLLYIFAPLYSAWAFKNVCWTTVDISSFLSNQSVNFIAMVLGNGHSLVVWFLRVKIIDFLQSWDQEFRSCFLVFMLLCEALTQDWFILSVLVVV